MKTGDRLQQIGAMQFMARDFVAECLRAGFDPVAIGCALITAGTLTVKLATDEATATDAIGHLHQRLVLSGLEPVGGTQ